MDKETIVKNFSKCASSYDQYTYVQNEAAGMLAKLLPKNGIKDILEIGCGTGNYTALLRKMFKDVRIKAVDISEPMVRLARQKVNDERVNFEVGDAEEIELGGKYDLVTSNATFHWLSDLEGIIKKAERSLSENGILIFSAFGPNTFLELKNSLSAVVAENVLIATDFFPKKSEISELLQKYFRKVKTTERLIRESYPSLHELLKKIKYSGARGSGAGIRNIWSPDLLAKIERQYLKRFGSLEATYQVFFCEAQK